MIQILQGIKNLNTDVADKHRQGEKAENLSQAKTTESDYSEQSPEKILASSQATMLTRIRQRQAHTLNMDAPDSLTLLREDRDR